MRRREEAGALVGARQTAHRERAAWKKAWLSRKATQSSSHGTTCVGERTARRAKWLRGELKGRMATEI